MNAVLDTAPDVLDRLPASDAPWTLTFDPWPHADAQRWRAVMATSARAAALRCWPTARWSRYCACASNRA